MVDNPLIPPTSRNVVSQNIPKPTSVTPDSKVSKVSIDKGLLQRSLVENKELDSVKLSEKVPTVPEETIPLPILANEELQGAEWAWRRVIFQTVMSMLAKAQATEASSSGEVSPQTTTSPDAPQGKSSTEVENAGNPLLEIELPALQSANSAVSLVNSQQAEATGAVPKLQPQPTVQPSAVGVGEGPQGPKQGATGPLADNLEETPTLSGPLSSSVAANTIGKESSGVPKDIYNQTSPALELGSARADTFQQALQTDIHETQNGAMKLLWNTLVKYGAGDAAQTWKADWTVPDLQGKVVPFSNFKADHVDKLPAKVKDWILADRLVSSTNQSNPKMTGEGIYFTVPSGTDNQKSAVRWKAERQTKLTSTHSLVHRLAIDVQVGTSPVKVTLVAADPTIMVHIATDDVTLRRTFQETIERVQKSIQGLGWKVDRATVGPLSDTEESL